MSSRVATTPTSRPPISRDVIALSLANPRALGARGHARDQMRRGCGRVLVGQDVLARSRGARARRSRARRLRLRAGCGVGVHRADQTIAPGRRATARGCDRLRAARSGALRTLIARIGASTGAPPCVRHSGCRQRSRSPTTAARERSHASRTIRWSTAPTASIQAGFAAGERPPRG